MNELRLLYRFFSSYGLATIVLVLLTIITLFGTLDQSYLGLWGAVTKYFHSSGLVVSEYLNSSLGWKIPIILPGGLLLIGILFINMVLGSLVHVRKRVRGIPNLIAHLGILFLLVSAYVTYKGKNDGFVALFPGQVSNVARSYKTWQLEVLEFNEKNEPIRSHIIPWEELTKIGPNGEREFFSKSLPFSVKADTFLYNAQPIPTSAPLSVSALNREINGFKLLSQKEIIKEGERNIPGFFAKILDGEKKVLTEMIISGFSSSFIAGESPRVAGFKVNDKQYGLLLTKTTYPIDFYIKLDKFIYEKHPGTNQAKNYESRVTRLKSLDGKDPGTKVAIRMNDPMRHGGFVVFQESFGSDPRSPEKNYSQFAVSDNPSDQWPLYALIVMTIGMLCHFVWKLIEYINKSMATERLNGSKKVKVS